jgi:hypothetical protein
MSVIPKISIALCLPVLLAFGDQLPITQTFNEGTIGAPPAGFTFAGMRQRDPGRWVVQKRDTDLVLVHERGIANGHSLAISPTRTSGDVVLTTRIRFVDGDRIGGLVWHYVDDQRYYSLVFDLKKNEIFFSRVSKGNRVTVESEIGLELDPKAWLELKVIHAGETVDAFLRGVRVFKDHDSRNWWNEGPSRAGYIAADNSGVEFDDLGITAKERHP